MFNVKFKSNISTLCFMLSYMFIIFISLPITADPLSESYDWKVMDNVYNGSYTNHTGRNMGGILVYSASGLSLEEAFQIAENNQTITHFHYFFTSAWVPYPTLNSPNDREYNAGDAEFFSGDTRWVHDTGGSANGYYKLKHPYQPTYTYDREDFLDYIKSYAGPVDHKVVYTDRES